MKTKKLLLTALFFLSFFANAAVITVSNNPNSPGQFTSLQAAIDAAAPNDVLYVHGSATNYGSVNVDKPLSIIGDGVLPNKSLHLSTSITTINFKYNLAGTQNASGSSVSGCSVDTIVLSGFSVQGIVYGISNITLKRNKINSLQFPPGPNGGSYSNFIIQNNIISGILQTISTGSINLSNAIISNNIINYFYYIQPTSGGNNILVNNIFRSEVKSNKGCFFTNNIFLTNGLSYNTQNTFTKNIFYVSGTSDAFNQATFESSQNSFSGNLYNQNPNFISLDDSTALNQYTYTYPSVGPFINYNLAATSPGKNYGTDGTDVGIYGGATPYVEGTTTDSRFRYFPQPAIPQMMEMTILNSAVPQNGTLNVNFTAKKND